ncbi:MAG: hypothetical protein K8R02_07845 [Anaerohalosphaeraceae bacterium]|nr:hypothetical protein [Anaerohalosphaeraceae bacterium]
MTKIEACKMLRVSPTASLAKKELAYRQMQKNLQLKLIPGNPITERRWAREQLSEITMAHQILQKPSGARKPVYKRPATWSTATKPETLGDSWDLFVSLMPFPEPVIVIFLVVVVMLVVVGLFSSL